MGRSVFWGVQLHGAFSLLGRSVAWDVQSFGAFSLLGRSVAWVGYRSFGTTEMGYLETSCSPEKSVNNYQPRCITYPKVC